MSEMTSLKKEIFDLKDEIKAAKKKEMNRQEEKPHNLELQLEQETETDQNETRIYNRRAPK